MGSSLWHQNLPADPDRCGEQLFSVICRLIVNRFIDYGLFAGLASTIRVVDDIRALLGQRIRALRNRQKLSQEELSHRAGVHWTYISAVERGQRNVSIDSIGRIAQGLQITLMYLFSGFARRLHLPPKKPHTKARRRRG